MPKQSGICTQKISEFSLRYTQGINQAEKALMVFLVRYIPTLFLTLLSPLLSLFFSPYA